MCYKKIEANRKEVSLLMCYKKIEAKKIKVSVLSVALTFANLKGGRWVYPI